MAKTIIQNMNYYDGLQLAFLDNMVLSIKRAVEKHVTDAELSKKIVESVTFAVCCDIDGSSIVKYDEKSLAPALCFEEDDNKLVVGPSWMHDYAFDAVNDVYFPEDENEKL